MEMGQTVETNTTTVVSRGATCARATRLTRNASPRVSMLLLLAFDFQVNDRLLAGVKRAQRPRVAGGALIFGFERVVHVRIESMELERATILREERTHLPSFSVLQLDYCAHDRVILRVGDGTLHHPELVV